MELWNEVLRVALLGTERQAPAFTKAGSGLANFLQKVKAEDREGSLLAAAGAISLYRRAGRLPNSAGQGASAAESDSLSRCGSRASRDLGQMLDGSFPEVLSEWLSAAAAAGKRVPEEQLPKLLEHGARHAAYRESILKVIGNRGAWLAAQNPEWSYASTGAVDTAVEVKSLWETSSCDARVTLLRSARKSMPDFARDLVISTWKQDAPDDRAQFLATFDVGLSMKDETLLEECLDDKRKEVRQQAAELLARLPESRFSRRMIERAKPLLSYAPAKRGILGRLVKGAPRLEVQLAKECDKSAQRDGVQLKPSSSERVGEKAWWLQQILSSIPPEIWTTSWQATPQEIIAASDATEFSRVLLNSWSAASIRFKDAAWAHALLDAALLIDEFVTSLVEVLATAEREKFAMKLLAHREALQSEKHPAVSIISACRHPWSPEFSRAVVGALKKAARNKLKTWHAVAAMPAFALYCAPSIAPEAARDWPREEAEWDSWKNTVEKFLVLLQFRHDMLAALKES